MRLRKRLELVQIAFFMCTALLWTIYILVIPSLQTSVVVAQTPIPIPSPFYYEHGVSLPLSPRERMSRLINHSWLKRPSTGPSVLASHQILLTTQIQRKFPPFSSRKHTQADYRRLSRGPQQAQSGDHHERSRRSL
jgi:hypothetical protein